jgi:phenylpropionate dioxygenase-like ring-hydroxylating dioxygenase large terminal subunit
MTCAALRYFHPVLPTAEVRSQPRRVQIDGWPIVLFRDKRGCLGALDDFCPHRRAPLSRGAIRPDGRLACSYHGWHFDTQGRGQSPACPELKRCDTKAWQAVERFGFIWLADAAVSLDRFPLTEPAGFQFAGSFSTTFAAPIELTLDNITEDEHFAYVHSTFGWEASRSSEVEVETRVFEDRTEVRYQGPQRSSWFGPLGGVRAGDTFHNEWVTTFEPVRTVYTFGWRDSRTGKDRPIRTQAAVFLLPESDRQTRVQMFVFVRIAPSLQSRFAPLFRFMAVRVAKMELRRDATIIAPLAGSPMEIEGMRLTRFDKALAHNRKLLRCIYWAERGESPAAIPRESARRGRP